MAIIKSAPEGANVLDLEAARAARAEARTSKSFIKLSAGYVEVNPEIALVAVEAFAKAEMRKGLEAIVVDKADADALLEAGFSRQDLTVVMEFATGSNAGE